MSDLKEPMFVVCLGEQCGSCWFLLHQVIINKSASSLSLVVGRPTDEIGAAAACFPRCCLLLAIRDTNIYFQQTEVRAYFRRIEIPR